MRFCNSWNEPLRAICDRLRRNDAKLDVLHFQVDRLPDKPCRSFVESCGTKLLARCEALEHNTVVSTIHVCVATLVFIKDKSLNDNTTTCGRAYNQFLQFIATHSSLRKVSLDDGFPRPSRRDIDQFCGDFLSALALNPTVADLSCSSRIPVFPPTDLAIFLLTTNTLTVLRIALPETEEEVQIIASGIEGNGSLERLYIIELGRIAHAAHIFRQLPKCNKLRELSVSVKSERRPAVPDEWQVLSEMLPSSSLESLELLSCYLDRQAWERLSQGLRSIPSLTRLTLGLCKLEKEAFNDFVRFFNHSPVKELRMCITPYSHSPRCPVIVSLLTAPCSTLERLLTSEASGLFRTLEANCWDVHVPCLHVTVLSGEEDFYLAKWLPQSSKLRALTVESLPSFFDPSLKRMILDAMRQNGSLHHVNMEGEYTIGSPNFSASDAHKIEAYCRRNQELPTLLQHVREIASLSEEMGYQTSLFPMAVVAAQQSPRMAATTMLIGLLAAHENDAY
jgi:hypothetical protein